MQNQRIAERQLSRLGKNLERVQHGRHDGCAPGFVPTNTQAIRTRRRSVVLIVMMREVDVVHTMYPLHFRDAIRAHRLDGSHSGSVLVCGLLESKIPGVPALPAPDYRYAFTGPRAAGVQKGHVCLQERVSKCGSRATLCAASR